MNELAAWLRSLTALGQGLFLAVVAFAGVFVVIAAFFGSIILLERLFRAKKRKQQQ